MMARTLAAVAREVHGQLAGPDASFGGVSIDSRKLDAGDLFVAIKGERSDGNDFVGDAHSRGAAGALVARLSDVELPQVEVADTTYAFGEMARAWRRNFDIPVVAVTGSNGKTTVKELIATILSVRSTVCATQGTLNNHLGVPLTLMTLGDQHEVLVTELGANHAGEIDYLASLAEPTVGVITNANASHLEGFGSIAGVAAAKGELLDHLPRAGTAVLNADDPHFADWRARTRAETVLSFGLEPEADYTVIGDIRSAPSGSEFSLRFAEGATMAISLPLLGRHNVINALAAAAAASASGASPADIVTGLSRAHAVRGRVNIRSGPRGSVIIDDSYNANPASTRAALDYLAGLAGTRVLVFGDMGELGDASRELHAQIGTYARPRCDALLCVGELSRATAESFGDGAQSYSDLDSLRRDLEPLLAPATTVLIKGSRFMGLDRFVGLLETEEQPGVSRGAQC